MQSSNKQTLKLENNEIDDLTNLANRLVSQVIQPLRTRQAAIVEKLTRRDLEIAQQFEPFKSFIVPDQELHSIQQQYQQLLRSRVNNLIQLNAYLNQPKEGLLKHLDNLLSLSEQGTLFSPASEHNLETALSALSLNEASTTPKHGETKKPRRKHKRKKKRANTQKRTKTKTFRRLKKDASPQSFLSQLTILERQFNLQSDLIGMINSTNQVAAIMDELNIICTDNALTLTDQNAAPTSELNHETMFHMATLKTSKLIRTIYSLITSTGNINYEQLKLFLTHFQRYNHLLTINPQILQTLMQNECDQSVHLFDQLLAFFDLTNLTVFSFNTKESYTLLEWCIIYDAPMCFKVLLSRGFTPMNIQSNDSPLLALFSEVKPNFMLALTSYVANVFTPKFNDQMKAIMLHNGTYSNEVIDQQFILINASLDYLKSFKRTLGTKTVNAINFQMIKINFSDRSEQAQEVNLAMRQRPECMAVLCRKYRVLDQEINAIRDIPGARKYLLNRGTQGKEIIIQGKKQQELFDLLSLEQYLTIIILYHNFIIDLIELRIQNYPYTQYIKPDGTMEFKPQYQQQVDIFLRAQAELAQQFNMATGKIMLKGMITFAKKMKSLFDQTHPPQQSEATETTSISAPSHHAAS